MYNENNFSGRQSESPSNSVDVVGQSETPRTNLDSDSDMEFDIELWQNQVVPEEMRNLSPNEKKRQDVINGMFKYLEQRFKSYLIIKHEDESQSFNNFFKLSIKFYSIMITFSVSLINFLN